MAENTEPTTEPTTTEPQGAEPIDWEAKFREAQAQSRKWEERAKANKDKAKKWDEYEQQGMSEAEKVAKRAEAAEAELAKLKAEAQHSTDAKEVSKETGVPESLLLHCADREGMEALAKEYAGLSNVPAAPPAPDSRVIRGGDSKKSNADRFADAFGDML